MSPVNSVVIPKGVTIVTAAQGGTQIPASGGSIINFDATTVYVVALQEEIGLIANAAPIVQGAALPWPNGVTCYGWVAAGQGSVYVTPINSSVYPIPQTVTIGGQPIQTSGASRYITGSFANPQAILGAPTSYWMLTSVSARVTTADSVQLVDSLNRVLGAVYCPTPLEWFTQPLHGIQVNDEINYAATNVNQAADITLWYDVS